VMGGRGAAFACAPAPARPFPGTGAPLTPDCVEAVPAAGAETEAGGVAGGGVAAFCAMTEPVKIVPKPSVIPKRTVAICIDVYP
jgi:hypothetical protein